MCSVVRTEPRVGEGAGHVDAQTVLHRHCALHPELIPRIPLQESCRDTRAQQPCQDQHRPLLLGTPGPQPTHRPTAGAAATASPWSQGLSSVRLASGRACLSQKEAPTGRFLGEEEGSDRQPKRNLRKGTVKS